jgi:hypothetical protein
VRPSSRASKSGHDNGKVRSHTPARVWNTTVAGLVIIVTGIILSIASIIAAVTATSVFAGTIPTAVACYVIGAP